MDDHALGQRGDQFLPFNQGDGGAAGNPVTLQGGHRTAYLWGQVWARESWLEILGRHLVPKRDKKKQLVSVVFPRFHQLDVTRKPRATKRCSTACWWSPGTGRSRALTFLALAGATSQPFFGLPVHRRFRTMILQCENGRVRLKNELDALPPELDSFIRYSPSPPYGFAFDDPRFLRNLREEVERFQPNVFALDPWNRLARDDRGKDYQEAFEAVASVLPAGDDCPAIGIVAHTRKPQGG